MDVDGKKWAVVLLTLDYGSPEAKTLVSDRVHEFLGECDQLLTAIQRDDGTLGLALNDPELKARILAQIEPVQLWKSVRLYP